MPDRAFLSAFTPSRTRPEDLDAIFVQRHDILNDTIERVQESATTGNKHHLLFVGPRGTGKTHLVTLLVHRLGQDERLTADLRIAWLNEDETSTTLLELFRRIYLALTKRYPGEYSEASLEPMFDLKPDEAEQWLGQLLLKSLQERTLLIIIENLDALFLGLSKSGQQKLRAFIQENPVLSIVATAQRLVDDLTKRTSAFFGFFQTEQLKTLSVKEAAELLSNIAALNKQEDVATFLCSATGRSRIRALHHLSGGNHRIYIVLSQFITRESIDALVVPFSKMVDEMTPYYQERIRWLPPQQRKIIEYLCTRERPTPVKEVARQLFASHQTISSQLKELRKKGYVKTAQRGRESLYEIAEPLMRICVEIKENQSDEPLRMLVDFLRVWYDGQELTARLEQCDAGSMAQAYLKSAIERNTVQGNLRAKLLAEGLCSELSDQDSAQWESLIKSAAQQSEALALACGELAQGDELQALATLEEIAGKNREHSAPVRAFAWVGAAEIYYQKGMFEKAVASCNASIDQTEVPAGLVALALMRRGKAYSRLGDSAKAIADYSQIVDLVEAPVDLIAEALCLRGFMHLLLGDPAKAMVDWSTVVDLTEVPVEQVAKAHYGRGRLFKLLNDLQKSSNEFEAIVQLKEVPIPLCVEAHLALATVCMSDDRWGFATSTLANGLVKGKNHTPPCLGDSKELIATFFESALTPKVRQARTHELVQVYQANDAIPQLGEALTKHLGLLYADKKDLPTADHLELWASAWEEAGKDIDTFRLPLRIFRTGIDFLKSGGKDCGILLDLNQEERRILEQALSLSPAL